MKKSYESEHAFTLLELMAVVMIVGVLSAVAVPAFKKYMRKSKTGEALLNLRKIYDGEMIYFTMEHVSSSGSVITPAFIETTVQPPWPPLTKKQLGNFNSVGWESIQFATDSPTQYVYFADAYPFNPSYPSRPSTYDVTLDPPSGIDLGMQVMALGDIDGDGEYAEFRRSAGRPSGTADLKPDAGVYILDELE